MTTLQVAPDPRPPRQGEVSADVRREFHDMRAEGVEVRLDRRGALRTSASCPLWHLHWLQAHAHEVRDLLNEERERPQ